MGNTRKCLCSNVSTVGSQLAKRRIPWILVNLSTTTTDIQELLTPGVELVQCDHFLYGGRFRRSTAFLCGGFDSSELKEFCRGCRSGRHQPSYHDGLCACWIGFDEDSLQLPSCVVQSPGHNAAGTCSLHCLSVTFLPHDDNTCACLCCHNTMPTVDDCRFRTDYGRCFESVTDGTS